MLLNRERAYRLMENHDIDVLIATSPRHVMYTTNFWNFAHWTRPTQVVNFAVLPKGEEPTLIHSGSTMALAYYEPTKSWTKDVRFYGSLAPPPLDADSRTTLNETDGLINETLKTTNLEEDALTTLVNVVKEGGFEDKTIGIDELSLAYPIDEEGVPSPLERLRKSLPKAKFVPATSVWREIRAVKTEEEIRRIGSCARITLNTIKGCLENIVHEGVTEKEIERAFKINGIKEGASGINFVVPSFGSHSAHANIQATDAKLRQGDLIYLDCGLIYENYVSDVGRTVVLGNPTEKQKRYITRAVRAQELAIQAIRPGLKASDIHNVMMKNLRDESPIFRLLDKYPVGHGIGLETYDMPALTRTNKMTLEENMVLNVEAYGGELGWGGIIIEDTVLVTRDGAKPLITHSQEFPFV